MEATESNGDVHRLWNQIISSASSLGILSDRGNAAEYATSEPSADLANKFIDKVLTPALIELGLDHETWEPNALGLKIEGLADLALRIVYYYQGDRRHLGLGALPSKEEEL